MATPEELAGVIAGVRDRWIAMQHDDKCADLYSEGGLDAIDEIIKKCAEVARGAEQ